MIELGQPVLLPHHVTQCIAQLGSVPQLGHLHHLSGHIPGVTILLFFLIWSVRAHGLWAHLQADAIDRAPLVMLCPPNNNQLFVLPFCLNTIPSPMASDQEFRATRRGDSEACQGAAGRPRNMSRGRILGAMFMGSSSLMRGYERTSRDEGSLGIQFLFPVLEL